MVRPYRMLSAVVLATGCIGLLTSCRNSAPQPASDDATKHSGSSNIESLRPAVTAFCGDCHAQPPPQSFPKDAWFAEVEQGYRFYLESGRSDLNPPAVRDAVDFFRAQAPETLPETALATPLNSAEHFRKQALLAQSTAPAISFLEAAPQKGPGGLWYCDMHSGAITVVTLLEGTPKIEEIAQVAHPAHLAMGDLDADGQNDLIVAELGSFTPGDHEHGKVWWIPGAAEPNSPGGEPRVLLDRVGRVADVQPADFDGDGKLDLVVAEFGWRKSGRILVLLQTHSTADGPQFRQMEIDQRHGTIHVPVCDLNQDGKPDFLALISQEHELIEAYLNQGNGQFEKQRVFSAGDPAFGSSGTEMVDLDLDGDLDVLATNGDTLDSHYLKPSHGITWLENRGTFPFEAHRLAFLPGCMRAVPADLDRDGDLDIVACAFLPATLRTQRAPASNETLIWLEQTQPGKFERHTLEVGEAGHMTVLAADLDADGSPDLIVPNYAEQRAVEMSPLTIWWNNILHTTITP